MRSGDYDEGWLADFLIGVSSSFSRIQIAWLLLKRTTFRHWRKKAGHYFLLIAIVAVGVGAFNGIRQASRSATANFGLFNQAISGQSDFLIESPIQRLQEKDLDALST